MLVPSQSGQSYVASTEIPAALKSVFLARGQIVRFSKDQIIVDEGALDNDVYWIQGGSLQFSLVSIHGKEVILRNMVSGEIFGEGAAISGLPRSVRVTALCSGLTMRLSGKSFLESLMEAPEIGVWLSANLAVRVNDLTAKVFEIATLPIAGRVQLELLKLAKTGDDKHDRCLIRPFPTHTELAFRIGTHREAVTRELNTLAREGIVVKMGRDLEISSLRKLRTSYSRFVK